MHELSIALEVCRIAESQVEAAEVARIREVGVDVGEQAGVEPDQLAFWLETLLAEPPFERAVPVLRRLPGDALNVTYLEVDDGGPDDRGP